MKLEDIQKINHNLNIRPITSEFFSPYGKILYGYDVNKLIGYAENHIQIPECGNSYVASVPELETFDVVNEIKANVYGYMQIVAGSCTGHNSQLTGVEYHQGSEVVIAVTDCIHIIGKLQDIINETYDSKRTEVFFQPKGTAIELYSTTLHYSPCKIENEGFMTIVILPKGTNDPLIRKESHNNKLLTKKNKFLMVHSSQTEKIQLGVHPGLTGELIEIKLP